MFMSVTSSKTIERGTEDDATSVNTKEQPGTAMAVGDYYYCIPYSSHLATTYTFNTLTLHLQLPYSILLQSGCLRADDSELVNM